MVLFDTSLISTKSHTNYSISSDLPVWGTQPICSHCTGEESQIDSFSNPTKQLGKTILLQKCLT